MIDTRQGTHRVLRTGLTLLACLLFDSSRQVHAEPVDDVALAFVQERHLGNGLAWLGYQVASRTATFTRIVETIGKTEAQTLVQGELQRLQPDYQAEWDRNLAAAYAHSFSSDELRSLNQGDSSPSQANRLKAGNTQVGAEMKATSSALLERFVSRALSNAQQSLNN
ncbi:hypothetical protein KDX38_24085 [Pseudomonas sp. CDFA 602]|uniref:hypothetical protein n=1 Tax=Pseudomonas californiensis TaxID=2829823 RepID=UPI001E49132A|nr:hypothetical protein [Pseudomonas californiensis]MCD5996660.1 hypothetical protein [Pseudomonas californiensis]MCD6002269.1 hypothetical protein [Pseudomonas californiensis]